MIEDDKLVRDETRRISQHENIKGEVRNEVHSEIAQHANNLKREDRSDVESLAGGLRQKAVSEIADTEVEIERAKKISSLSQVIDYIFCVIYGIIGLEIGLEILGARDSNGFKRMLDTVASPLLAPFRGLMPDPSVGRFQLMLSYIVALVVYVLLHLAVNGLLRLFVQKKRTV